MENYNNEREHDLCLISLVEALDEADRLDIFRDAFCIEGDLGPLRWAGAEEPSMWNWNSSIYLLRSKQRSTQMRTGDGRSSGRQNA